MDRDAEIKFYKELASEIKPDGYKCWLYDEDYSAWLYIVTPNNSLLYVDNADFGGFNVCFEWEPQVDFGSGCRYNEDALWEITRETLEKAEKYGRAYRITSRRYKTNRAPKYFDNALDALNTRWCADKLIEL